MLLGSADILLTELTGLLTPAQRNLVRQVAVCRAPMTLDDLAFTLTPSPRGEGGTAAGASPDLTALPADVDRLTDLTLLTPGDGIVMHPWTAALVTRNIHDDLSPQHEAALAMRWRRFNQRRGTYDDLIDICRHLAALHRYDDIADIAQQATQIVPGTLSLVACLAEMRPLIPPTEQAWIIVAGNEADALLRAGNMPLAAQQLQTICRQVETQVAAEPSDTGWQRLLSVSHSKLGDVAVAAGDLAAARTAYQASLDIACPAGRRRPRQHRMAAGPVGQPQQAGGCGGRGRGPGRRAHRLPGQPGHRRCGWPPPTPPTRNGSATCRSRVSALTTSPTPQTNSLACSERLRTRIETARTDHHRSPARTPAPTTQDHFSHLAADTGVAAKAPLRTSGSRLDAGRATGWSRC